jgi:hypothetical protein
MDERLEPEDLPDLRGVRPGLQGRGLALPPLAPLALVVGVVAGLAVGLSLAPVSEPAASPSSSPTPGQVAPTVPPPEASDMTYTYFDPVGGYPLPSGGLSLGAALEILYGLDATVSPEEVASATIVSESEGDGEQRWAWAFTIETSHQFCFDIPSLQDVGVVDGDTTTTYLQTTTTYLQTTTTHVLPAALPSMCFMSRTIELDYFTGEEVRVLYGP